MLKSVQSEHRDSPQVLPAELPVLQPDPTRIAVLLNRNARRVNDRVTRKLEHIVGKDHVFVTNTIDEAEAFSREVVQRGYGTIVSGGGDGTAPLGPRYDFPVHDHSGCGSPSWA